MSKSYDFNKQKKEYLTITLPDEKKTTLMIGSPTKSILEEFVAINERVTDEDGADLEAVNDLYSVCAKIMSFNKGGINITSDDLSTFFDIEDVMTFFNLYSEFMASITKSKN